MRHSIQTSPFMKDVIWTSVTSVLTILSFIVVTRILADGLGPERFGAYSMVRRILATIEPFSTLGMGVALSRYIAIADSEEKRAHYFLGGMASVLTSCLLLVVAGLLFQHALTQSIFHSAEYRPLFLAMLFLIVGYSLYVALYSLYRGLGRMDLANYWQLALMAVAPIPVAVLFVPSGRVDWIVLLLGAGFFLAAMPLIACAVKSFSHSRGGLPPWAHWREILGYSLPRVPTQIAFGGILMVGPFFAPYFGGMKEAGYLVVSESVLRVVEGGVEGFSRVALPAVARIHAEGRREFLRLRMNDLMSFIFHIGFFATVHLFLWADQIVLVWLGRAYEEVIPLMRWTILAIVPFIAYSMLRSVIDAVEKKAVNARNLYVALATCLTASLGMAFAGLGILGLALGMTAGFWVLGVLTCRFLWRLYETRMADLFVTDAIVLNVVLGAAAIGLKYGLEKYLSGLILISVALVLECALFLLYCMVLWKRSVPWTLQLMERLVRHEKQPRG
jgi:O-antigen/teichoic acid export membrane protein